jgi:hypothetical protein
VLGWRRLDAVLRRAAGFIFVVAVGFGLCSMLISVVDGGSDDGGIWVPVSGGGCWWDWWWQSYRLDPVVVVTAEMVR